MNRRAILTLAAATALALAVPASALADSSQTPVATGCPAGYEHVLVSSFPSPPYQMPARVDAAGNDNGWICAQPLPEAVAVAYCLNYEPKACTLVELGLPLYNFIDDNNPAHLNAQVGG